MKTRGQVALLIAGILLVAHASCFAQSAPTRQQISAVGVFSGPPVGSLPVVDTFNEKRPYNNVGGYAGSFDLTNSSCVSTFEDAAGPDGSVALKLVYDVSATDSFSGYYSKLNAVSFSPYGSLTFRVRGAHGGEYFKIQLTTNSGTYRKASVAITDALDGPVTTSWQTVTIPVLSFFNLADVSDMKELVFVFENVQSTVNGSPRQGEIYIDDIVMSGAGSPATLVVDSFSDLVGTSALGGNIATFGDKGTVALSYDGSVGTATYDIESGGYAGVAIVCGGGTGRAGEKEEGWQAVERSELLGYNGLRVALQPNGENPKVKMEIKVKFAALPDLGWCNAFKYFDPTLATQDLLFSSGFQAFVNGTLVTIDDFENQIAAINGEVVMVFEYRSGESDGALRVDSISFIE